VLTLELPPGAALSENELAAALGVSRTPVRESRSCRRTKASRGKVHRESLPGTGAGTVESHMSVEESAFVGVEVRHAGGHMAALSNAILLT
jgi:hypothetical protein